MRTWLRLSHRERCGRCGQNLPEGTSAQEILLHGVKRKHYRGECCAGAAPPDLPALPVLEPGHDEAFFQRLSMLGPARTRGALREMAQTVAAEAPEWMPYRD